MVNLVGKVPPLEASGAAVTLVHPTATTVVGQWDVTYPQDIPDEQRPDLGPTRTFGYAHRLVEQPPRFARRHVRRDVQIDARDKNGWSNAEAQIDSAARELSGDVVFQRTLTRDDLGVLVPNVDFKQGDVLPLLVWGMIVPATCTSIRYSLRDGRREVEVGFGPSLMADTAGLAENMQQIDRQMRAEAAGIDEQLAKQLDEAKSHTEAAVAAERTERRDDVKQVREVLGGEQADEGALSAQLSAVQSQITGMVDDGETPPPPGLLNSYLWMNTQLWEAQQDVNRLNSDFREQQREVNRLNSEFQVEVRERQRMQQEIDARQDEQTGRLMDVMDEQAAAIEALQRQAVSVSPMMIFADGADWKEEPKGTWTALGSWRGAARVTSQQLSSKELFTYTFTVPREDGSRVVRSADYIGVLLSGEYQKYPGKHAKRSGSWGYVRDTTQNVYKTLYSTTIGDTGEVFVDTTVWLDAAHRGATYSLGVWVDGVKQKEFVSSSVGPLLPSGDGHVPIRVQGTFGAAKNSRVEVRYSCSFEGVGDVQQRRVRSGGVKLSWIEAAG